MSILLWALGLLVFVSFGAIVLRGAPYVPTHRRQIEAALAKLYDLGPKDLLVDLGSGDGIVLGVAASRGARAVGYELNPFLVWLSRWRLRKYPHASVQMKDFLALKNLPSDTTVVYAFTVSHSIEQIGRKLSDWSADRELYFISYGFKLKDKQPLRSLGAMYLYRFETR